MPGTGLRIDTVKVTPDNNERKFHQFTYAIVYEITQGPLSPQVAQLEFKMI